MRNGRNGANGLMGELKVDAIRYFKNGATTIKSSHRNNSEYADAKPIQEAAGVIYLGVLKALDAFALTRGYNKNNLPDSLNGYLELLSRHAVHNGKMKKEFLAAYGILHIAVYYKGQTKVDIIKDGIKSARFIIEKLTGKRIG